MRFLLRFVAAAFVLGSGAGCGSAKTNKQVPTPSQVEPVDDDLSEDPTTGIAALAGSWTGNTEIKGYGMARAVLILDAQGYGTYYGSLAGVPENGSFWVSYWDGQWLQAATMGFEERVRGTLNGNQLHLELPYVGSVVLYRASK